MPAYGSQNSWHGRLSKSQGRESAHGRLIRMKVAMNELIEIGHRGSMGIDCRSRKDATRQALPGMKRFNFI